MDDNNGKTENKEPTDRRIMLMIEDNPLCEPDDASMVFLSFGELRYLRKFPDSGSMDFQRNVFYMNLEAFTSIMRSINRLLRKRGFKEPVFRKPYSFDTSSDDYDYYFEPKTLELLEKEEAERKNGGRKG